MLAAPPPSPEFGKYRLLRRLAQGGMAEIFLAIQQGIQGFEKLVVLKRVLPDLSASDDFVQMFLDEARVAAKLDHPNIVRIYDLGEVNGQYYIAMEYIPGEDLASVLQQCKRKQTQVPVDLAADAIIGAAEALHFAHEMEDADGNSLSIVHRDVTPSNILVTYQGMVKLVDFGIARAESNVTKTEGGQVKGKTQYLSPEQIRGARVDRRADVFALGIVMHELLTGQRLFQRDNQMSTMHAILLQPIPPPSALRPDIPPELDAIVMRALERDTEQRYQTAAEMAAELSLFLVHRDFVRGQKMVEFLTTLFGEDRKKAKLRVAKGGKLDELAARVSQSDTGRNATPGSVGRSGRFNTGEFAPVRTDGGGLAPPSIPAVSPARPPSKPGLRTPTGSQPSLARPATGSNAARPPTGTQQAASRPGSNPNLARPPSGSTPTSARPPTGSTPAPARSASQTNLPAVATPAPLPPEPITGVPTVLGRLVDDAVAEADAQLAELPVVAPAPAPAGGLAAAQAVWARLPPKARFGAIGGAAALLLVAVISVVALRGGPADPVEPLEPADPKLVVKDPAPQKPPDSQTPPAANPGLAVGGVRFTNVPAGARVLLDKNPIADPAAESYFAAGKHQISVDARGFLPFDEEVDLAAGQVVVVDVRLKPRPAEVRGTLQINCQPWCEITLDGKSTGKTSPARLSVSAGTHTLLLSNPPAGLAKKLTVEVPADRVVTKLVKLDE